MQENNNKRSAEFKISDYVGENRNKAFIVPLFQREYVWEENNWSELFDNIISNENPFFRNYFAKTWK